MWACSRLQVRGGSHRAYGGARTGRIGFGVYLIWPAFFTDVTDSYRLSRAGRLRTDLGGLYFNAIFILGLAGAYAATGAEVLLLAVAVGHYAMLEQLLPFVRFDGYFILSDLVGVPDLFGRVTPILRGILPSGRTDPRLAGLHRGARVVITIWVACVIPLLVGGAGYIILHLPKLEAKFWHNTWQQTQELREATRSGNYALALVDLVNVAVLALVIGGTLLIFAILASRVVRWMARWMAGRPRRQASAAVTGVVMCVGIATYWTVTGQFAAW